MSDLASVPLGAGTNGNEDSEFINLGSKSGTFKVSIDMFREADKNSYLGFVQVNENFEVNGFAPNQAGFAEAALSHWFGNLNNPTLNVADDGILRGAEFTLDAAKGHYVIPFLVTDTNILEISNPDVGELAKQTFFSVLEANPDGVDHVKKFGANVYGFEDMSGGGDGDYDDLVFHFDIQAA